MNSLHLRGRDHQILPDPDLMARVDEMATRHTEGQLSPEETAKYGRYVSYATFIAILKAKARLRLSADEFPPVHLVRPGQAHRCDLRQVAQALPHAVLALRVAVEEHGDDAAGQFASDAGRLLRLFAGDGVRAQADSRYAERG